MTKEYSIAGHSRLAKANLGGLPLFKDLTDKSRDTSQAEKKISFDIPDNCVQQQRWGLNARARNICLCFGRYDGQVLLLDIMTSY